MANLNIRQQLFVKEYIALKGNGTEAARKAGYKGSDKALNVQSQRLLGNAWIKSAVAAGTEKALAKAGGGVSTEEVIDTLTGQMRGELPARWSTTDGKDYDPQKAAAILGRFLGLEKPKEVSQVGTINLLQAFVNLDAQTVEAIRAATVKALPAGAIE